MNLWLLDPHTILDPTEKKMKPYAEPCGFLSNARCHCTLMKQLLDDRTASLPPLLGIIFANRLSIFGHNRRHNALQSSESNSFFKTGTSFGSPNRRRLGQAAILFGTAFA